MRDLWMLLVACSVATTAVLAQPTAKPNVLDRVLKQTRVQGKPLIETTRLLESASGVPIKIAAELQACAASDRPGCDWRIHTAWDGQTLAVALDTLCGSTQLAYRVVDGTILITRQPAADK
jgi:hypothetical protein